MEQPNFKNLEELKNWIINGTLHFAIHQEGGFYLVSSRVIP